MKKKVQTGKPKLVWQQIYLYFSAEYQLNPLFSWIQVVEQGSLSLKQLKSPTSLYFHHNASLWKRCGGSLSPLLTEKKAVSKCLNTTFVSLNQRTELPKLIHMFQMCELLGWWPMKSPHRSSVKLQVKKKPVWLQSSLERTQQFLQMCLTIFLFKNLESCTLDHIQVCFSSPCTLQWRYSCSRQWNTWKW